MEIRDDRDIIVVANPGTGKTREIVDTVNYLLKMGIPGEQISCLTFTNKAAGVMHKRLMEFAKDDPRLLEGVLNVDIGTIHSQAMSDLFESGNPTQIVSASILRFIAYRILNGLGTFTYGPEYLKSDVVPKIENAIRYVKSFGVYPESMHPEKILSVIQGRLSVQEPGGLTLEEYSRLLKDFIAVFQEYEAFKRNNDLIDYNDVLTYFLKVLDQPRKEYVLVDEFQDLSRIQIQIAEKIARHRFFVGDRKQSIFGFQGGSISGFDSYIIRTDFRRVDKKENHRSTNNILRYSTSYFLSKVKDHSYDRELKDFINPEKDSGQPVSLLASDDPEAAAVSVLKKLLRENKNENLAIIVRKNSQIARISSMLEAAGIEFASTLGKTQQRKAVDDIMTYLRGVLLPEMDGVKRAIFTPFSGLSFREAMNLYKSLNEGYSEEKLPEKMKSLRTAPIGAEAISEIMKNVVLPISASLDRDYFVSAEAIYSSSVEFLQYVKVFHPSEFLDFLELSLFQEEGDLREDRVNLLTVHKAKGLEFDTVIYVPSPSSSGLKFIDLLSYSIVYATTGVDAESDLTLEPTRIDYVAMTRAKNRLYISTRKSKIRDYAMSPEACVMLDDEEAAEVPASHPQYDEAYSFFVNGRHEDARKLIDVDRNWLRREIFDYFENLTELSYSLIGYLRSPLEFLKNNILRIKWESPAANIGTVFHQYAKGMVEQAIPMRDAPEEIMPMLTNLDQIIHRHPRNYEKIPMKTEYRIVMQLSKFLDVPGIPDDILIKGTIDALFADLERKEFLVLDYKTSRSEKSDYWWQIWTYCRLLAKSMGILPDEISGAIAYVSLRSPVKSGDPLSSLEVKKFSELRRQASTVEAKILQLVEYKDDPEKFIKNLLSETPDSYLDKKLQNLLG